MKSYQAYLFDFDYTLADSSKGIVMCYRIDSHRSTTHYCDTKRGELLREFTCEEFSVVVWLTSPYDRDFASIKKG